MKSINRTIALLLVALTIFTITPNYSQAAPNWGKNKEVILWWTSYRVRSGDRVWSIAQTQVKTKKVKVQEVSWEISNKNNLFGKYIYSGQRIWIPVYGKKSQKGGVGGGGAGGF